MGEQTLLPGYPGTWLFPISQYGTESDQIKLAVHKTGKRTFADLQLHTMIRRSIFGVQDSSFHSL